MIWPSLAYEEWKETYATLHLWTQVVGKVALALAQPLNHSWQIAFHLTPRGLSTLALPVDERALSLEFDFVDHLLRIRCSDGREGGFDLGPLSVAAFYREVFGRLEEFGVSPKVWPVSVELPVSIRLDRDEEHRSYDPEYAHRLWHILLSTQRVLQRARSRFIGKASPAHFFWGSFDLALSRFSGREAPPREGPEWMQEAYSHEVISHGFWPGSFPQSEVGGPLAEVREPIFYMYAVPAPEGFSGMRVRPEGARYDEGLMEFVLPYEAVRTSPNPDQALLSFVESTYEQAAALAGWDREALER